MIEHDQLHWAGPHADCFTAALECILEWSIGTLPRPSSGDLDSHAQWQRYHRSLLDFLAPRGWWLMCVSAFEDEEPWSPPGWAVGTFKKPRSYGCDILHALVCRDGRIVHDPHPLFRRQVSVEEWGLPVDWELLVPLNPALTFPIRPIINHCPKAPSLPPNLARFSL